MINKNLTVGKTVIYSDGTECEIKEVQPTYILVGNDEGTWIASISELCETYNEYLALFSLKFCPSCEKEVQRAKFTPKGVYCKSCTISSSRRYIRRQNVINRNEFKDSYVKKTSLKRDIYMK